ncbi:MAG TPA: N-formylglutamate amidohydrolase [Stellaceae bacterium]|nr:N-formylglutamate amidohydrolase [Stellaceae bacterium]
MTNACLGPGDPPPVITLRRDGTAPVLVTCDHASKEVPRALGGLGLEADAIAQHIGWDIGAANVACGLAERLDVPAILAGYSRLVIDCNRDPDDASSIPEASDGIAIPGNLGLLPHQRAARRAEIFAPYHAAIAAWIETRLGRGTVPALLSIHSFTPVMAGKARPWHVGILWDDDPRIPVPLLGSLRADPALAVGDNQPYSAREPAGFTVRHHAVARGLPHVAIELRQDLIGDQQGAAAWAERLAAALGPILARAEIYFARG